MARLLAEALSVMEETEGARLTVAKPAPKEVPA
jgi:hypothetical protein